MAAQASITRSDLLLGATRLAAAAVAAAIASARPPILGARQPFLFTPAKGVVVAARHERKVS
jgi:hypothetical protein